ncbi:MAG: Hint domain-containing protein [Pseudomonadota bacterium]
MPSTSSQFIYIGNLPDIDTDESDHDSENPNAVYGHYGNSEIENIIVTQTDDDGDGQLQTDDNNQSADTFTYDKGNGPETNALDSAGRYEVSYTDENGDVQSTVVSVYQTDNGDTFLKFPNGLQVRDVTVERIVGDGYTSITYGTSSSSVVVCFSADCEIDTLQGPRRIGDLAIGDRVLTLEHGCQEIRWLRTQTMPPDRPDDDAPILIAAHALGPNRPARDLIVSPQHRILVGGNDQMAAVFSGAALVPAKALTGWPGIRVMRGRKRMTWVHFACDAHEIVRVNGAYSETLLIGRMVLDTL